MIVLIAITHCAQASAEYELPRGKSFGVTQGLSQVSVLDIKEDRDGFIWIATQAGVDRFNGTEFSHIGSSEDLTKGLPANFVNRLQYDASSNALYVATINGLSRLSLSDSKLAPIPLNKSDGQTDINILSMHIDKQSNFWVGTSKSLFVRPKGAVSFNHIQIDTQLSINDIISLDGNDLLLATSQGLKLMRFGKYTLTNIAPEVKKAYRLLVDDKNRLWVGTDSQGVFVYDISKETRFSSAAHFSTKNGLASDEVNTFMQSTDGVIWVGTSQGANLFNGDTLTLIPQLASNLGTNLSSDALNVYSFYESQNGQILVGTRNAGFSILDPGTTLLSRKRFGMAKGVENITAVGNDSFWVTTQKGLFKFDTTGSVEGPWNFSPAEQKIVGLNAISGLAYQNESKTLWLASRKGLARFKPGDEKVSLYDFEGIRIYSIAARSSGELWLGGAENGLFLYQPQSKETIKNWEMPLVTGILEVNSQEIWVTTTGGLYLVNLEQDTLTHYRYEGPGTNSLPIDGLGWISQKNEHEFYLGTLGRGAWLMTLSRNRFEISFSPISSDTALSNISVGAVIPGNDGALWVPTTSNMLRIDNETKKVTVFDKNDGANEGGYYVGAAASDSNGTLYFAGLDGLTFFNPRDLDINNYVPRMHIDGLSIVSRTDEATAATNIKQFSSLAIPDVVTLTPNDFMLNIDMIALEYADVPDLQYAYRVPEIDPSWQILEIGKRSATLMNLAPGSYSFEVKVKNRFLEWSEGELGLSIRVLPSWWQTPAATILFILLLGMLVISFYKWRTFQFRKRSHLLEQKVEEQTIALKEANDSLTLLSMQDSLLDVFNRRGFLEWLEREDAKYKRSGRPYSIILLDVDYFKKVNDRFGHASGDKALLHITDVLKKNVRGQDTIARWGGEEFIILLPYTDINDASLVAEKIREAVEHAPLMLNHTTIHCTITCGIASIKDFGAFEECVSHADMMLYKGKAAGRNRVMFR